MTLLRALGEAWTWFRKEHTDLPLRIAYRTGQVFELNDNKVKQFEQCRFRGYVNEDKSRKNPFAEKQFQVAMEEYIERNNERREHQKVRRAKKEEKKKQEEERNKQREAKKKQKSVSKKKGFALRGMIIS